MLKKFVMIFAILFLSSNFSDTHGASVADEENTEESEESSDEETGASEEDGDSSSGEENTEESSDEEAPSENTEEDSSDEEAPSENTEEDGDVTADTTESENTEEEAPIADKVILIRSQFNPKTCPKIQGFIGDDPKILKPGTVSLLDSKDGKKIFKLSSRYSGTGSDVSLNDVNVVDENGSPLRQGEGLAIRFGPKTNNASPKTLKRLHQVLLNGNYKPLTITNGCGYYHPDDLDEAIAYVYKVRVKETF